MPNSQQHKKPVKRLTHAKRAERRENMAARIKAGESLGEVARKYGVTVKTVREAVREFES